jgi:S1-C subfamily serine protease
MRIAPSLAIVLLFATACQAQTTKPANLADHLQNISVTIHAGNAQGSGTIVVRGDTSYVLTCGHVIDGLRKTREAIDAKGGKKTIVEFADAKIVKELVENGRSVGRVEMDAEVLRYSDADTAQDLALLRVRKTKFVTDGATFWSEDRIPPLMTRLVHCGSLLGQFGSNSITAGIISQHGRVYQGVTYDQCQVTIFPGSSGGGLYTEDGKYVGVVVRGAGEGFGLYVPIRRVKEWANRVGVGFVLDPSAPVPDEKELKKLPIEDTQ